MNLQAKWDELFRLSVMYGMDGMDVEETAFALEMAESAAYEAQPLVVRIRQMALDAWSDYEWAQVKAARNTVNDTHPYTVGLARRMGQAVAAGRVPKDTIRHYRHLNKRLEAIMNKRGKAAQRRVEREFPAVVLTARNAAMNAIRRRRVQVSAREDRAA